MKNQITYSFIFTSKDFKRWYAEKVNIAFYKDGVRSGYGFKSKRKKTIKVIFCPRCGCENVRRFVNTGKCGWCEWVSSKAISILKVDSLIKL